MAIKLKDTIVCDKISNDEQLGNCYNQLAEINKDSSLCKDDGCRAYISRLTDNPKDCLDIVDEYKRWKCLGQRGTKNNDLKACKLADSIPQIKCFTAIASSKKDITLKKAEIFTSFLNDENLNFFNLIFSVPKNVLALFFSTSK